MGTNDPYRINPSYEDAYQLERKANERLRAENERLRKELAAARDWADRWKMLSGVQESALAASGAKLAECWELLAEIGLDGEYPGQQRQIHALLRSHGQLK